MTGSRRVLGMAILAGLLGLAPGAAAHAQEALTVEEFRIRIEGKLPELARFEADILSAEADVAEAQVLPSMSLSYEREEVFTDGEGIALTDALTLGWSLDISGRRKHRTKSAEARVKSVQKSAEYGEQSVTIGALRVYYRAAYARLRAESLEGQRSPLEALVERLENRVHEGDASGYDLARFELQLSEHDDALTDAKIELAVAQAELAALLGAPGTRFVASSSLPLPIVPVEAGSLDGARRDDMLATRHEEQGGRALVKAASQWWIPQLDLSIGYLNTDLGPGSGPGANVVQGYTGMVSASIPVFSKGRAERKRGEAQIRRAQATRKILERRISTEIESARTRLTSRIEQTQKFKERQLVRASEFAKRTEAAYQGGEASALELRDAYTNASAAQLRFIDLRYQCGLAELALWSATGVSSTGVSR
ncbi:MAG: TolC family protein [Myxococcales bacterium]|nr:TolC family protein [Myxococcales bacterium]